MCCDEQSRRKYKASSVLTHATVDALTWQKEHTRRRAHVSVPYQVIHRHCALPADPILLLKRRFCRSCEEGEDMDQPPMRIGSSRTIVEERPHGLPPHGRHFLHLSPKPARGRDVFKTTRK